MSKIDESKWDLGSKFLSGKNAVDKSKAIICSNIRLEKSKFTYDDGNEKMDRLVDLKLDDGSIKVLRLNKASQKAFHNAGIAPNDVFGVEVLINVMQILVRGEPGKSIVINPTGNKVSKVEAGGEEIKPEDLNF